ncbi:MAG: Ldh family oxidoreductase [Gammaproteobacteria bacterium]|nr:Ldh family oxidoreductase [Gammaproteobacteria bacterium]
MTEVTITLEDVDQITRHALQGAGASESNAASVARSTVLAERDGIRSHGLMYVPIYAEHVVCGKVDGRAEPDVAVTRPGAITVDAKSGFAHPAIDAGWEFLTAAARNNGIAALTVNNSYNCGVLGHHSQRLAEQGLIGLCFTHAPASIAPVGASTPVIGTNPFAIAVPDGKGGSAIAIDQSASVVAKSEIMLRSRKNQPIEPHWALDADGHPTTVATEALQGSMAPAGGYKGFGIGLVAELLASCLAGALLSKDASPFAGTKGGPPGTGQCFIAFDPQAFSGDLFATRVAELVEAIAKQEGAHVPGTKGRLNRERTATEGIIVDQELLNQINAYA